MSYARPVFLATEVPAIGRLRSPVVGGPPFLASEVCRLNSGDRIRFGATRTERMVLIAGMVLNPQSVRTARVVTDLSESPLAIGRRCWSISLDDWPRRRGSARAHPSNGRSASTGSRIAPLRTLDAARRTNSGRNARLPRACRGHRDERKQKARFRRLWSDAV